jgi:hypothetical protein
MTDQEMIARFSDLEDQDGIFAARIVACEVNQLKRANYQEVLNKSSIAVEIL